MKKYINDIKALKVGKVLENVDLKKFTTYKVGGIGKVVVYPKDEKSLIKLLKYVKEKDLKYKVLGFGSNLIFPDEGYDGVLIRLDEFNQMKVTGTTITVGAGYSLIKLCLQCAKLSLAGIEFASGIPGTIGGAVYMNAGAYKSDMGYIVREVKVLTPDNEIKVLSNKDMDYHYRSSFLQKNKGYICLEAKIKLYKGDKDAIMEVIKDRKKRRLESQPLEYPSAGSVFRNPENDFAGRLIEELGYKGKKVGGAMVSTKHANFIVNSGNAKASDVIKLIRSIQKDVKEKYDIDLKCEQEIVE